mmetsp:Transcript_81223/g.213222  ORF Transcript_81223/g.213222 Transcript_81223/m.213222 type:complete len:134 (+) Transcript_81223:169-570(+)
MPTSAALANVSSAAGPGDPLAAQATAQAAQVVGELGQVGELVPGLSSYTVLALFACAAFLLVIAARCAILSRETWNARGRRAGMASSSRELRHIAAPMQERDAGGDREDRDREYEELFSDAEVAPRTARGRRP